MTCDYSKYFKNLRCDCSVHYMGNHVSELKELEYWLMISETRCYKGSTDPSHFKQIPLPKNQLKDYMESSKLMKWSKSKGKSFIDQGQWTTRMQPY